MTKSQKKRRVIFALDHEAHTEKAFDIYASSMHKATDEVTLLHIYGPPVVDIDFLPDKITDPQRDLSKESMLGFERGKALLETFMKKCAEKNIDCKKEIVVIGREKISDAISSYANGKGDLIVMGSGKHSAFQRLILGCVASNTLHKSSVPVLVIPPQKTDTN